MHPEKRDGGIMTCFLENDELYAGNETVLKSCLNELTKLSGRTEKPKKDRSNIRSMGRLRIQGSTKNVK